jgi:hypothetical protein
VGEDVFGDYPKAGWNAEAHVFTLNMFGFASDAFDHVSIVTIDKSTVLDADPRTLTYYDVNRDSPGPAYPHFTLAAASMHGSASGDPMWLVEEAGYGNGSAIRVVKMTNLLSPMPLFTDFDLTVGAYTVPPNATQPGEGLIQTNDSRILNAVWREQRLVAAHVVGIPSDSEAHVRWYEINTAAAPQQTIRTMPST